MTDKAKFYGFDMIPVYLDMSAGQLRESLIQLQNLEACQNKPHILDDVLVNRIIKSCKEQNKLLWVAFKQCKLWYDQNPTPEQLEDIERIEKFTKRLETTNERILFLATHYKDHTIDAILRKDDAELAIEYLLGKTYSPLEDDEVDIEDDKEPFGPDTPHDFKIFNAPNELGVKSLYEIRASPLNPTDSILAELYQDYVKERSELNDFHDGVYEEGMEDILEISKELGNFDPVGEEPVIQNEAEMNVFYDYLSLYREKNGKRFLCDWLKRNPSALTKSNEKVVKSYCKAQFAVIRIEKSLSHGALQVVDVISQKPYILIDKALNASKKEGLFFCCSIIDMGDYIMTTGGGIPVDGHSSGGKAVLTILLNHMDAFRGLEVFSPEISRGVRKIYGFCLRNDALHGITTNDNY